jgi:hypothetical protein
MADHLKYINHLKDDKDMIRNLTDQLPIGIFRTSLKGAILYANPTLAKMFEYSHEEIYKISAYDLFLKKEDRDSEIRLLIETSVKEITKEQSLKTKSGKTITVKGTINVIRDINGSIDYFDGILEDITEQKKAKEALQESQDRYKVLTNLTVEGIIVHENGIIKDINPSALKITGYTAEFIIGKNILDYIHPNYTKLAKSKLRTRQSGIHEIIIICADNTNLTVEIEANNVFINNKEYRVVAFRDITKRKTVEKEILTLSTAIKQSPVSVIITDIKGNIEYVNPKFNEVTGYSNQEVIGKNPRILKTEHTSSKDYQELWNVISSGNTWTGEFLNKRKDGEHYWELASISPIIDDNGNTIKYLAIKEDITERKKTEDALIKSEKELTEANATKNMFFSIMAHDLKSPIGNFLQLLNLLKDSFNDISYQEKLDYINLLIGLSSKTNNLLQDLLLWAQIQMNIVDFKTSNIGLKPIINESLSIVEERANEKNITIEIETKLNDDLLIHANKDSIKTIFRNLLTNAIKFSDRKSTIKIAIINSANNCIEIAIKDKGVGIPAGNIDKLFKIETSFSTYGTDKEKGTGMGLILCSELIKKNGGTIRVESEEGTGSTFYFKLQLKR